MSAEHSRLEPEQGVASLAHSYTAAAKPQRLLSCVQCHQRKVKCDRKTPCANCLKTGAQCVSSNALAPRPRRRRFPERELLDRLRQYETLLRENHIDFEPLHPPASAEGEDVVLQSSKEKPSIKSEAVDIWRAISQARDQTLQGETNDEDDSDDVTITEIDPEGVLLDVDKHPTRHDAAIARAWTYRFRNQTDHHRHAPFAKHLLFDHPDTNSDLSVAHPQQAHIFKLWQIYLENVNPLLKVTHIPTLQPRILDAVSDLANVSPSLQALIFSIYCLSVTSLTQDECFAFFQSSRDDLLIGYQSACRQALLKCSAWRSRNVDSLTALYFYLLSVATRTDPQSLSSMFAVLIRTTQRMGMHLESANAKHSVMEAEMRRRLWWSIVMFDHRICELSDDKTTMLTPVWDCRPMLNVNDFELRPELKSPPVPHTKPTEALFAFVRSKLADAIRHSAFHISLVNPFLTSIAQPRITTRGAHTQGSELGAIEENFQDSYLAFCDPDDPLHFMTIWTTRYTLARNRLLEHYSRRSTASAKLTDAERKVAFSSAIDMVECDTVLKTSHLIKGYVWFIDLYFPGLAYVHLLNGLTKEPGLDDAEKAWSVMNANYEALVPRRSQLSTHRHGGVQFLLVAFSRVIIQAWDIREEFLKRQSITTKSPPRIVVDVRAEVVQMTSTSAFQTNIGHPDAGSAGSNINIGDYSMQGFSINQEHQNGPGEERSFPVSGTGAVFPDIPEQCMLEADMNTFFAEMDWRWMDVQGW